jgi:hypothetical protein
MVLHSSRLRVPVKTSGNRKDIAGAGEDGLSSLAYTQLSFFSKTTLPLNF